MVREVEVLTDAQVTLLSERRVLAPYGLQGGSAASVGRAVITDLRGKEHVIRGKATAKLKKGERIRVETPGGGGWGR